MTIVAARGTALVEQMLMLAHELVREGWCQGTAARDAAGRPVSATSAFASSWSAAGALERVWKREGDRFGPALDAFQRANLALAGSVGGVPQDWNDAEGRTVVEVLNALADAQAAVADSRDVDPSVDAVPLVA